MHKSVLVISNQLRVWWPFFLMDDGEGFLWLEPLSWFLMWMADNMLEAIYVHFLQPSKNKTLCEMQGSLGLNKWNVLRICDARWVCRYKNCIAMLKHYSGILIILNDKIEEQTDKDVARALDIIHTFIKPNKIITMFTFLIYSYFKFHNTYYIQFIIVLHILNEVSSIINVLSINFNLSLLP